MILLCVYEGEGPILYAHDLLSTPCYLNVYFLKARNSLIEHGAII